MPVIIFSKAIHSGKTTSLLHWCNTKSNCGGILMPDVSGIRKMYDIAERIYFNCITTQTEAVNSVSIGKYCFSQASFDRANKIITNALDNGLQNIVVDEVGKLELNEQGFYSGLIMAVNHRQKHQQIILVVRDMLLNDVIAKFNLTEYSVVQSTQNLAG